MNRKRVSRVRPGLSSSISFLCSGNWIAVGPVLAKKMKYEKSLKLDKMSSKNRKHAKSLGSGYRALRDHEMYTVIQ